MKTWIYPTCVKSSDRARRLGAFWATWHLQAVVYVLYLTMSICLWPSCNYLPVATSSRILRHVAKLQWSSHWMREIGRLLKASSLVLCPMEHIWYVVERELTIMLVQGCICRTKSHFMLCFQNLAEPIEPMSFLSWQVKLLLVPSLKKESMLKAHVWNKWHKKAIKQKRKVPEVCAKTCLAPTLWHQRAAVAHSGAPDTSSVLTAAPP